MFFYLILFLFLKSLYVWCSLPPRKFTVSIRFARGILASTYYLRIVGLAVTSLCAGLRLGNYDESENRNDKLYWNFK